MAAVYPSGIKSFGVPGDVVDAVDVVYAAHINDLRDEVEAVEGELGTGLKTSTWTGAFAQTGSWGNLALRLTNIERGIVTTSDVHTQYVKKAGDAMTGSLTMGGQVIGNLGNGSASTDAVNYGQVLLRSGANAATGNLNMGTSYKITNLADGSAATDAATKGQVDTVATAAAAAHAAVYAQGTTTTLTSGTLAKVTYTSEVDPSNMLSSGTFTLPTAGVWMVSSRATTSAAVLYSIEIRHSGTTIGGNTVGGNEEVESAQLVVASASDTIEVWVSGNGGTTAVRTVVARIGTT